MVSEIQDLNAETDVISLFKYSDIIYYFYVCTLGHKRVQRCLCGGQRTVCLYQFSPSFVWVLGSKVRIV